MDTPNQASEVVMGIMAYGAVVHVKPDIFLTTLAKMEAPLVLMCHEKSFISEVFQYLSPYKGLFFYVESKEPVEMPLEWEVVEIERKRIPNH